jgi:phosphoribosylformylglycinamidine cyclo-ligase
VDKFKKLTYKTAGVDIKAGDELVERIKPLAQTTFLNHEIVSGIGGFAAAYRLELGKIREPLLVSCTDGVGTKLKIAFLADHHDTVGIDLVAMNVNDLIVCGAKPLFFLDYFATGKLRTEIAEQVIKGIAEGCRRGFLALVGGETAEMPSMYAPGEYDLAGFAVGIVDRTELIEGKSISPGMAVIGLHSSGAHSNGYSLLRKIFFEHMNLSVKDPLPGYPENNLGEELLRPTLIYVPVVATLQKLIKIHGMAHITGSGLPGNIPRVLPDSIAVRLDSSSWPAPLVLKAAQHGGNVPEAEMWSTFNMGIGYVIITDAQHVGQALATCRALGFSASLIGETVDRKGEQQVIGLPL